MVKTCYINLTVNTFTICIWHHCIPFSNIYFKVLKLAFFFQNRQKIWGFKRLDKSIKNPEKWKLDADRGNASQSTLHYLSFALTARLKMWASAFQNFALQPCCQKLVQSAATHLAQRSKLNYFSDDRIQCTANTQWLTGLRTVGLTSMTALAWSPRHGRLWVASRQRTGQERLFRTDAALM